MNNELMEQCRKEAGRLYEMPVFDEHRFVQTTDTALAAAVVEARREAYAAALYAERSKGALRYRSECSGLWYTNREAAGDVDAVEVDGVMYVSNKQGEMLDKRRELTDEEIERVASMCCPGETSQIMQASVPNGPIPLSQGENIRRHIVMALRYARDNDYLCNCKKQ